MGKVHNQRIERQQRRNGNPLPPNNEPPSPEQLGNARRAATRTKEQIYNYTKDKAVMENSPLDIDGDGRVTDYDGKFIEAYKNQGKRGADLRDFVSPYANNNLTSITAMEAKVDALVTDKTLDLNDDKTVDNKDYQLAKDNISQFAEEDSNARLTTLLNHGDANIDGNSVTDDKDLALINAYIVDGKTSDADIKALLGANATTDQVSQAKTKLAALKANRDFDSNADGRTDAKDLGALKSTLITVNHDAEVSARDGRINNLITSKKLDVDGDGMVTSADVYMIKAYKHGASLKKLQAMANQASTLTGEQMKNRLKTLFDSGDLDINKNGNVAGALDLARILEAVKKHEANPPILGEGPSQP